MKFFEFFKNFNPFLKKIDIYTDGSHKGKWGSWAFVVVRKGKVIHEASGKSRRTNSHRMEFQAAIEALLYVKEGAVVNMHSDSKVLINCALNLKRPVVNKDQVDALEKLILKNKVTWNWVKAHAGISYNERCDELCLKARS